ncbi:hypothetical protein TNCT_383751 [Trichonephila clavata]|uniref:Uncharacterized protein n=1 Tax=Trichonephila clavata TaxID=2740835 RepID=A0A8X6LAL1_TRICU|nr:hypothetical protein TNCT_383751 [Trichonephila clavata]
MGSCKNVAVAYQIALMTTVISIYPYYSGILEILMNLSIPASYTNRMLAQNTVTTSNGPLLFSYHNIASNSLSASHLMVNEAMIKCFQTCTVDEA